MNARRKVREYMTCWAESCPQSRKTVSLFVGTGNTLKSKTENMEAQTLTPEQIKNWRRVIAIQLEQKSPGAGKFAFVIPEREVVAHWMKTKSIIEQPQPQINIHSTTTQKRPKSCDHSNSITGQNGTYCLDCEKYL